MQAFDFTQYSPEWFAARRGIPTASEFSSILTPKTMKLAAAHETYIHRLIGDIFDPMYGQVEEYASAAMRRGLAFEPESRAYYELHTGLDTQAIGFALTDDGRFGCSPDALVGKRGLLELKNPSAHTHVAWLLAGVLPDEHKPQVHGELIVTELDWCDFLSYCPGLPPLLVRVFPNDYTAALRGMLELFWEKYQAALSKIKAL